ncbi:MAG: DUF4381 family protein [Desulfosarcina sp.]
MHTIVVAMALGLALGFVLPAMGAPQSTSGGPLPATRQDAPAPLTDIHDIRPPVPVGFAAPWLVASLLVAALAAILILAWWWKKNRNQRTVETIVPELPPDVSALRALDRIGDVRRLDGKTFYYCLSAILRRYVLGRFSIGAPEMTTEEFLPCIDRLAIDRELSRRLTGLCRAMDSVKFGAETAIEKQMEADLLFAREFVRKTTFTVDGKDKEDGKKENILLSTNYENSKKQIPNFK